MDAKKRILVLHDRDRIGRAIVHQLEAAQVPLREFDEPLPADEIVSAAFGCRAIIAVGDRFAADPAVLSAANMPGVRALVLVVHKANDFTVLRKRGVPYTVLRIPLLLEDVISAVEPAVNSGRLVLDGNGDVALTFVAAEDAAACAITAVDHDASCGRIMELAAPGHFTISTVAMAIAQAQQRTLKVSKWPRWVIAAMRAIGRVPFRLPDSIAPSTRGSEDASQLHPSPWRTIEDVASTSLERREEHAMGMQ